MQKTHFWNQFYLRWTQIIYLFFLSNVIQSQELYKNRTEYLVNYDNQIIHFGFAFGGHVSKYVFKYSDEFVSPVLDSLHSITGRGLGGLKIGFIINFHLLQYLDVRLNPTFGLYENQLVYRYTNTTNLKLFKDATFFELPILLKYKSVRRGNTAFYLIGGLSPAWEASAKGDEASVEETLETKNWNLSLETGVGIDIYLPQFKLSPEIRYSWGLFDMLQPEKNEYNYALDKLVFQNLSFYITFEGGPSTIRKYRK